MSIHSSLCPHAHWAMYFWDMICVSVSFPGSVGTTRVSPRNAVFSAPLIGDAVAELISELRAFTKSMCDETAAVYAASAVALSPDRYAASALTNCSCEYVMNGNFDLSSKM